MEVFIMFAETSQGKANQRKASDLHGLVRWPFWQDITGWFSDILCSHSAFDKASPHALCHGSIVCVSWPASSLLFPSHSLLSWFLPFSAAKTEPPIPKGTSLQIQCECLRLRPLSTACTEKRRHDVVWQWHRKPMSREILMSVFLPKIYAKWCYDSMTPLDCPLDKSCFGHRPGESVQLWCHNCTRQLQLSGLVAERRPAALKVRGSNSEWGAQ